MNIKRMLIVFALFFSVSCVIYFFAIPHYPYIADDARKIEFSDITEYNRGNLIDKGVEVLYIDGHTSSAMHVLLDDCKPYKRLEMYESNDTFIVIYDEMEGEKEDRFLSIQGFVGSKFSFKKQQYEYKVEIYKNGRRVRNVKIGMAIE